MTRKHLPFLYLLFALLLTNGRLPAQTLPDQSVERVWLLGNTADIEADSRFYEHLRAALSASREPIHLIVAGDLIPGCEDGVLPTEPVERLFAAVRGLAHVDVKVLPGDRDWNDSGRDGWDCARALEDFVEDHGPDNIHWPVDNGCPGPEEITISDRIVLLALNTQWWNHPHRKPIAADALCEQITPYAIFEELEDKIEENHDKHVLLAGHFPPLSLGPYGGRFSPIEHLLPPVFGSARVAFRQHVGTPRDLENERFTEVAERLRNIASKQGHLIYLSGHERNQQVLAYKENCLINSGAPTRAGYTPSAFFARLALAEPGFMELLFYEDGQVRSRFHEYRPEGFLPYEELQLFQSPCFFDPGSEVAVAEVNVPCLAEKNWGERPAPDYPDSVTIAAGPQYAAGGIHKLFFGPHYRASWTAPVQAPVLDLDTTFGGLIPYERGGGRQTQSLKFKAADGMEYVFRSVDKDPIAALDYRLRNTIVAAVTRDQTSSQQPYGAMAVAPLLDDLSILHATPRLYLMPDMPELGPYREEFGNMLGMLEERPDDDTEPVFGEAEKIDKSFELFRKMFDENRVYIQAEEFARARILDLLIGDWSKHEDNWKWAGYFTEEGLLYRPIPRDRDHVFSNLDGLIPWLADRKWGLPDLEGFRYRINDVRSLTHQARHMDRFLANELDWADWKAAVDYVQARIDTADLHRAVLHMPEEVYPRNGKAIEQKLQARLPDLERYARRFYELLARQVDVVGSNERERFEVERRADGTTEVRMYDTESEGKLLYERRFLPRETKEIRLFGLHGADTFLITGNAARAIKLRIIGGPGRDDIRDLSSVSRGGKPTLIYEKSDAARVETGTEGRRLFPWNEDLYYYDRTAFAYNSYQPLAYLIYSNTNGLVLGGDLTFTRQHFNKKDFSTKHSFGFALGTLGNFELNYEGRYHHVLRKWDLLTRAEFARPQNYNFFFGLGNETLRDQELFDNDFYLVSYNALRGSTGLERRFWKRSRANLLLGYERTSTLEEDNILKNRDDLFGNADLNIFTLRAGLDLDLRDHPRFPTKGLRFQAGHESGLTEEETYGITDLSLEYYLSPPYYPVTLALRGSYAFTSGRAPFFKLPRLGRDTGLRGFQENRFTGDDRLVFNGELLVPIAKVRSSILPFTLGLRAFYDTGRIYLDGEDSSTWHQAYGGGFYIIPVTRSYTISALLGFSEEESGLISISLGTTF